MRTSAATQLNSSPNSISFVTPGATRATNIKNISSSKSVPKPVQYIDHNFLLNNCIFHHSKTTLERSGTNSIIVYFYFLEMCLTICGIIPAFPPIASFEYILYFDFDIFGSFKETKRSSPHIVYCVGKYICRPAAGLLCTVLTNRTPKMRKLPQAILDIELNKGWIKLELIIIVFCLVRMEVKSTGLWWSRDLCKVTKHPSMNICKLLLSKDMI